MTLTPSDFSPKLNLPYLLPGQAQKHVTVNESLRAIDALVMGAVEARDIAEPVSAPGAGQGWIIPDGASGAWADRGNEIAVWQDGAWAYFTPAPGWRVWSKSDAALLVYDAGEWRALSGGENERAERFGIAADADAVNAFSAKLNGALFAAAEVSDGGTGDLRVTLNKAEASNMLSLIFQTGYEGRAELSLTDADELALRVSHDGSSWQDALRVDHATGNVGIGVEPGAGDKLTVADQVLITGNDGAIGLHNSGSAAFWRYDGGPIFVRARSNGSDLCFGVTDSTGKLTNTALRIYSDEAQIRTAFSFLPSINGAVDLGMATRAFRDAYLTNAPIIASDMRGKQDVEPFRQGLELINLLMPVSYTRGNEDDAPYHFGLIAQQVKLALKRAGLEGSAIWQLADKNDPDSAQSVSYTELIPALIDAVQELSMRMDDLERVTQ